MGTKPNPQPSDLEATLQQLIRQLKEATVADSVAIAAEIRGCAVELKRLRESSTPPEPADGSNTA